MKIAIRAPADTGAGADFYNRRMVAALRAEGHEAAVVASGADAGGDWITVADLRAPPADADAFALIHHPSEAASVELTRFAGVIAAGEATAARLVADQGAGAAKLRVVPPGADRASRSAGSGGACHILSVGAITPRKGHDVLLRALGRLGDLDWRLTIAGDARDAARAASLDALAHELAIAGRVTLAGALGDEALETLWSATDLFALASSWEPHGTAVANALGHGVPVVATEASAAGVTVPHDAGALCEDGTALSKALRRTVFDAELRASFADGAWRAGQALPGWDERARAFAAALSRGA